MALNFPWFFDNGIQNQAEASQDHDGSHCNPHRGKKGIAIELGGVGGATSAHQDESQNAYHDANNHPLVIVAGEGKIVFGTLRRGGGFFLRNRFFLLGIVHRCRVKKFYVVRF